MRAMILDRPSTESTDGADWAPLRLGDLPTPTPGPGELLVRVRLCGVCRTDLDLAEGRLEAPRYPVVPGHQVIGDVAAAGRDTAGLREGSRVGVAWIHWACGVCAWCRAGTENLCPWFRATGCGANGGYAEYLLVPGSFAHEIPPQLADRDAAPLLCAGAIGLRSLRLTELEDGQPLGLTGFGSSAHLVLQLAHHTFPRSPVFVFARSPDERAFASSLGASWVGDTADDPPERPHAIIDTTPAWTPVLAALRVLERGGRLVINAIRKSRNDQQALLGLDYAEHLWMEREIKSVANVTRRDVRELLDIAASTDIRPQVTEHPLERANDALAALRAGGVVRGAQVLRVAAD